MKTQLSIEESARLIELGVDAKQASEHHVGRWEHYSNGSYPDPDSVSPLFSLADLISILPKEIDGYHMSIEASDEGYDVAYILYDRNDGLLFLGAIPTDPELIDSLNQLAIWCLTEKGINLNQEKQ
ncbi:MAG: hypothetical protein K2N48_01370 [Muribaculaceae bacterium]|nr:hypothetical protein [Muribaculaceae bacterium]